MQTALTRTMPFWLSLVLTTGCVAPHLLGASKPASVASGSQPPAAASSSPPAVGSVTLPSAVPTSQASMVPQPASDSAIVSVISVVLDPISVSNLTAGGTSALSAIATFDDGDEENDESKFVWSSSDTSVATVSSSGLVTGVRFGTATIQARLGTIVGTCAVTVLPTVSVLAGSALSADYVNDATGTVARFNGPSGGVVSGGHLYVADSGNHAIRQLTPGGAVTTFAGASNAGGNDYVNGTGTAARFDTPVAIAADKSGNLYVCDRGNHAIRKITSGGVVTTYAGADDTVLAADRDDFVDGTGSGARFNGPSGIAIDAGGNLYVCDRDNHAIRKIDPGGAVTTFAGAGADVAALDRDGYVNGTGTDARFDRPTGIAIDRDGNLYVSDSGNHAVRKITPAGVVTTFAGADEAVAIADRDGYVNAFGTIARFNSPYHLVVDEAGALYVTDRDNHAIRKISALGDVTTFAGSTAGASGSTDGLASVALFNGPEGIALGSGGVIYVLENLNHSIRKVQ